MAWFKCFIHGERFPGELIGEKQEVGFYTTRFVEASDAEKAEILALENLREEINLKLPEGVEPTENAKVFFEEIEEVSSDKVPKTKMGLSWYVEGT